MKTGCQILLAIIVFACLFPISSLSEEVKIFMVQSYSERDLCGMPQLEGALKALKDSGFTEDNSKIYYFFMDTKKHYTTEKQIAERGNIACRKITSVKPDVVITFDDNAFRTLAPELIHTRYKLIFTGINRPPEEYNKKLHFMDKNRKPAANITGVYEKLHIEDNFTLLSILNLDILCINASQDLRCHIPRLITHIIKIHSCTAKKSCLAKISICYYIGLFTIV